MNGYLQGGLGGSSGLGFNALSNMGAITDVDGSPIDPTQWLEKMFWDRRSWGAAVTAGQTNNYFAREGNNTTRDTNMLTASQFPAGTRVIITTIQVIPAADVTLADLVLLQNNLWLYSYVDEQEGFQAPIWHTPAGAGPSGYTTRNATDIVTNGVPNPNGVVPLATPIIVDRQSTFQIRITSPAAITLSGAQNIEVACRCLVSRRIG